jgi:hypothetical protein
LVAEYEASRAAFDRFFVAADHGQLGADGVDERPQHYLIVAPRPVTRPAFPSSPSRR